MIFRWRCPCALSTFPSTYYGLFFRQTATGKVLSFCPHISLIGVFMCNFSFVAKDFLTKAEMATQESFNADGEGNADQAHAQDAQIGGSTGPSPGRRASGLQRRRAGATPGPDRVCLRGGCRSAGSARVDVPLPEASPRLPHARTRRRPSRSRACGSWVAAWPGRGRRGGAARGVGASCGACAWSAAGLRVWGWGGARPRLPRRGPLRQCGRVPPASRRGVLGAECSPGPARDATRAHVRRVSHSPPAPRAGRPQPRAAGPHVATERSRRLGPGLVPHRRARRPSGRSSGGAAGPRGASAAPSVCALLRGPSISDSVTPGGWGSFPGVCFPLDAKNSACHIT